MPSSYTSLLGLVLPVQGELQGTWGDTVNNELTSLVDSSVAGTTTLSTDADVTLTDTTGAANQARQIILNCTGSRSALRTITAPARSKAYIVINNTTGGFGVKIVGAGPTTGVSIANGTNAVVAWNGADFEVTSSTAISDLTGTLPVSNGGTGATTLTGVVKGNGTSAFTAGNVSLSSEVTGTLPVANGGTGATTLTGVVRGNGTSAFTTGSVSLASEVTGTLPVANGGTGATNLTGVVRGNGTSAFTTGSVSLASEVTGTLPVSNGGTGATTLTGIVRGNGTSAFTAGNVSLTSEVTGTLPIANGGTNLTTFPALSVPVASTLNTLSALTAAANQSIRVNSGGTAWEAYTPSSGTGDVTGPASSVSGNIATFNGTSGKIIQDGGKALPTGAIVGTTDSQTLTNKTLSVDSNTLSGIAASSFVLSNASGNIDGAAAQKAIPSGDVVGTTDTQTLTNKTLTSPTINDGTTNLDGGTLILPQTTTPAQTAEGSVVWDTDNDLLTVGTGAARKTMVDTDSAQTLTNKTIGGSQISGNISGNAANVTGTVAVANGGTGATTFTANNVLLGNGTSAFQVVAPSTSGNVLTSNGTTWQSSPPAGALPSQTGNAGKFLSTDGTNPSWQKALAAQYLPIFSSASASVNGVSSFEEITPSSVLYSTGLSGTLTQILFANSLYIAVSNTPQTSVATSSDGETWTLRTMPLSAIWYVGQDGNNLMAISGIGVVTSTDGITWTSATSLPLSSANYPAAISGTWVVARSTASNYVSTDFGATWSAAQTLPAAPTSYGGMFVVNGYFWYISGSTAYYSTTGLTGSWTSVALPVAATAATINRQNNTVYFSAAGGGSQIYRVDDETTFTAITNASLTASNTRMYSVSGVWAGFNTIMGGAGTYHNGQKVLRVSDSAVGYQSYESGGVSLLPFSLGNVGKYTGSNGPTAVFTV